MYESKKGRSAKASHYVSLANGGVYPAMRNVPGYEDDNPSEWRVATRDEVDAYEKGETVAPKPAQTVELSEPVTSSTPQTLTLAEDDPPPAPQAVLQQAAAALPPAAPVPQDPPPLPPQFSQQGVPGPAPAFPAFNTGD